MFYALWNFFRTLRNAEKFSVEGKAILPVRGRRIVNSNGSRWQVGVEWLDAVPFNVPHFSSVKETNLGWHTVGPNNGTTGLHCNVARSNVPPPFDISPRESSLWNLLHNRTNIASEILRVASYKLTTFLTQLESICNSNPNISRYAKL